MNVGTGVGLTDFDTGRLAILGCAGVSAALLTLSVQRSAVRAMQRYQERYTLDATHSLRDLYLFLDVRLLWPVMVWLAVTVFLFSLWFGLGWFMASMLAMVCLTAPGLLIRWAKIRRLKRFGEQLPDALQSLSASLAAGTSLVTALQMLVQYSSAPLAQEFSVVAREVRLGVSLESALQHLMVRMPCTGVRAVGATLMVAIQTGGPMAEMLAQTASSLITELQVQQRASALMSQGWMQAWVMGCLPLGLMAVLSQMDERFGPALVETTVGQMLIGVLLALELVGILWLRRIARKVAHG